MCSAFERSTWRADPWARCIVSIVKNKWESFMGRLDRSSSQGLAPSPCLGKICPEPSFVILKNRHHICTVPMANVAEFLGNQSDSI